MNDILSAGYGIAPTIVMRSSATDSAKLLYIQISSFCASVGHCWASNAAFEELGFGKERTVQKNIRQLVDLGFVRVELIASASGVSRRIFLATPPQNYAPPPAEKCGTPPQKNAGAIYRKNSTNINNIKVIEPKGSVVPTETGKYSSIILEIWEVLQFIEKKIGITEFAESEEEKRKAGWNFSRLREKLGAEEFEARVDAIVADDFRRRNCGRLNYLYREIKGFVPGKPGSGSGKRSGTVTYSDDCDRQYLEGI